MKGLSHALIFDGKGGAKKISSKELESYSLDMGILWVHFDYSFEESINWITNKSNIDPLAIEALLAKETRPRTTLLGDSILLALRGINLNPNSDPEDMISIRLFINDKIIISTKKRDLLSVKDILDYFDKNCGPKSSSEFLIELTNRLTYRMEDNISEMEDRVSSIEELSLDAIDYKLKTEISDIRRESIALKRYLAPQKDAMNKLFHEKISWLSEYERIKLQEITDQLIRYIEELDSIKDKILSIQEDFSHKLSEEINNRMYFLSIISAIFLPLGFLTGLLGINVGGIPGAEYRYSFHIFVFILCAIVLGQYMFFKNKKWF